MKPGTWSHCSCVSGFALGPKLGTVSPGDLGIRSDTPPSIELGGESEFMLRWRVRGDAVACLVVFLHALCLGAVTHDDAADVLEVELVEVGVGEEVGQFAVSAYEGDAESDGHLVGWWVNGRLFGNSFFFFGA